MKATPCALCHKPRGDKHPKVGERPCIACHPTTGASWKFVHPKVEGDCAECHKAPANHPAGSCVSCHAKPGKSWAFSHPRANADCTQCHKAPARHPSGACVGCHKSVGRSWEFAHPRRVGEHSYRRISVQEVPSEQLRRGVLHVSQRPPAFRLKRVSPAICVRGFSPGSHQALTRCADASLMPASLRRPGVTHGSGTELGFIAQRPVGRAARGGRDRDVSPPRWGSPRRLTARLSAGRRATR